MVAADCRVISPRPFIARVGRRLGLGPLTDLAAERVQLSPPVMRTLSAAISLPGEFDRAFRFHEGREIERLRIEGGMREDGPTTAFLFRDALVAKGAVFKGAKADFYRHDAPRFALAGHAEELSEGLLAASMMGERYFGDWLVESFSLGLIAQDLGLESYAFARQPWLHEAGYQSLFGFAPQQVAMARFERLWIIDDRGMNAYRRTRFQHLRATLRSHVRADCGLKRVYLARGSLGQARDPSNGAALADFLSLRGYTIVHPETEEPLSLLHKLSDAKVVVSVEGSAQVHAVLAMPDGATLTNLQPPLQFTAPGKDMADLARLHYAYLVGDLHDKGFSIDLARLGALLDRIDGLM